MMANKALISTLVLLGCAAAATAATALSYKPIASTTSTPIDIGPDAIKYFVDGAKSLSSLGPKVTSVSLSRYADPEWDSQFAGSPVFWMGVAHGGCGYGNLLDPAKYPYLMGLSLSAGARKELGFTAADGVGCGACIRITCNDEYYCPDGATSAVGVVLDVCPDMPGHDSGKQCNELQADMYIKAWEAATGKSPSNPSVILERVMCPDPKTNIQGMVMSNAGTWGFLKLNFQNVGGEGIIQGVDYTCRDDEDDDGETVKLVNAYGAVWQTDAKNAPKAYKDCKFSLHMPGGKTLETSWLGALKKGSVEDYPFVQIFDTGVQHYPAGSNTTTTTTTWTAPAANATWTAPAATNWTAPAATNWTAPAATWTAPAATNWTAPATNVTSWAKNATATWNTTLWSSNTTWATGVAGRKLM